MLLFFAAASRLRVGWFCWHVCAPTSPRSPFPSTRRCSLDYWLSCHIRCILNRLCPPRADVCARSLTEGEIKTHMHAHMLRINLIQLFRDEHAKKTQKNQSFYGEMSGFGRQKVSCVMSLLSPVWHRLKVIIWVIVYAVTWGDACRNNRALTMKALENNMRKQFRAKYAIFMQKSSFCHSRFHLK